MKTHFLLSLFSLSDSSESPYPGSTEIKYQDENLVLVIMLLQY